MAIRGINMIEEFPWSSEHDDGQDPTPEKPNPDNPKTVFRFGGIDAVVRTQILDNELVFSQTEDGRAANTLRTGLRNVELVRFMIKGVTNYNNPEGNPIELVFEDRYIHGKIYKVATEHFISTLPPTILNEMGNMLVRKITDMGALVKNSKTP